jgi:hypothetical protein
VWIYDDFTISSIYQKNKNYLLKICKKYQDSKKKIKKIKSFMLEPCIARAMSLVLIQLYKLIIAVIFNFIRSELMEVIFLFLFFFKIIA